VLDGGAAKARTARKLVLSVDKAFRRARVTCNAIGPYTQPERQSLSQIVSTVKDDTILANDSYSSFAFLITFCTWPSSAKSRIPAMIGIMPPGLPLGTKGTRDS
jgi:hypothetical protein